jgi:hypothetical protein
LATFDPLAATLTRSIIDGNRLVVIDGRLSIVIWALRKITPCPSVILDRAEDQGLLVITAEGPIPTPTGRRVAEAMAKELARSRPARFGPSRKTLGAAR